MPVRAVPEHLTVFTSCIWQTTSTLVKREDALFLFDPAYFPHEIQTIADMIRPMRRGRQLVLVLTHGDWDHIAGFAPFADAVVVAHRNITAPGRLEEQIGQAAAFDQRYYVARPYALVPPRIDRIIAGEERVKEWGVRFLPVPGHTADMLGTLFEEERTLVVGDMLSDLEFPFVYHDSGAYLQSLEKVEGLLRKGQAERIVPGHGTPALTPDEALRRIAWDRRYLEEARELVFTGYRQGMPEGELRSRFLRVTYKGSAIPQALVRMHEENFDQLWREASRNQAND